MNFHEQNKFFFFLSAICKKLHLTHPFWLCSLCIYFALLISISAFSFVFFPFFTFSSFFITSLVSIFFSPNDISWHPVTGLFCISTKNCYLSSGTLSDFLNTKANLRKKPLKIRKIFQNSVKNFSRSKNIRYVANHCTLRYSIPYQTWAILKNCRK